MRKKFTWYGRAAEERFWSHIERRGPRECWIWFGSTVNHGHGRFRLGNRLLLAHRYSYELAHGPISDGVVICHSCDTPACCNPAHLAAGSQRRNMGECAERGRTARGERHPKARLTREDVDAIRAIYGKPQKYYPGNVSISSLATKYGVAETTIHSIVHYKTWTT